jgi:DNA-binding NtrC family response regulator
VDDELQIRKATKYFLEVMGYEAYSANSLKETFTALDDVDFHIVIVDLVLPDVNGEELIKNIAEKFPAIKFIIHTGSVDYTPPDNLKKHGVSVENVLFKPYRDISDLENKIKLVLNK